jgi:hypothetical protein
MTTQNYISEGFALGYNGTYSTRKSTSLLEQSMKLWLLIEDRFLPVPKGVTVLANFGEEVAPKQVTGGKATAHNCVVEGTEAALMSWLGGKEIWVTENSFNGWNLVQYGGCNKSELLVKALVSALMNDDITGTHKVVKQMAGYIHEKYPDFDVVPNGWNLNQHVGCDKPEQMVRALVSTLLDDDRIGSNMVINQMSGYIYEKYPELANGFCAPDSRLEAMTRRM